MEQRESNLKHFGIIGVLFIASLILVNWNLNSKSIINADNIRPMYPHPSANMAQVPGSYFVYVKQGAPLIDPHTDSAVLDARFLFDQVCEGLFCYNITDANNSVIPNLAVALGTWSEDNLNYTVTLRTGISFQDGTKFNATAVKWSFDRLAYFLNATGELTNTGDLTQLTYLYVYNGQFIINSTEIISEYVVEFHLNMHFSAFPALLCFEGSFILSPTSTPAKSYMVVPSGILVGTGPYAYSNYYSGNQSFVLNAFTNYWQGVAKIPQIRINRDVGNSNLASTLSNGYADMADLHDSDTESLLAPQSNLTGFNTGKSSLSTWYISMNTNHINKTMRQAISFAVDYASMIQNAFDGHAFPLKSIVPSGISFSNETLNCPLLDVSRSREILQNAGLGLGLTTDSQWISKADSSNPIATYNFTYNADNLVRAAIGAILQTNLKMIGIKLILVSVTWSVYVQYLYDFGGHSREQLDLCATGWTPDYNAADNYLFGLLNSNSQSNTPMLDDSFLDSNITSAMTEVDPLLRKSLYDDIQQRVIEDLMPYVCLCTVELTDAYNDALLNFSQNGFHFCNFRNCEWTWQLRVDSPLDASFVEGDEHPILWTPITNFAGTRSFSISNETQIVNSGTWQNRNSIELPLSRLSVGVHVFNISVTCGSLTVTDSINVTIVAKSNQTSIPVFLLPLLFAGMLGIGLSVRKINRKRNC